MAAAAPIASGIGSIMSIFGGSQPRTSTSSFNQSGTQTADLDPKQQRMNKQLFKQLIDLVRGGPTVSQSDRNAARGQINDTYNAQNDALETALAARGMGTSGTLGKGFRSNAMQKANAFQGAEATLRDQAWNRWWNTVQSAFQFNQPRSFSSTSSGTSSNTQPGANPLSMGGAALGDLSSYMYMRNMMNQSPSMSAAPAGQYFTNPSSQYYVPGGIPSYPCKVAEALYGVHDWRTQIARGWLTRRAAESPKWEAVVMLYAATGRVLAFATRHSRIVRAGFKAMFDGILKEALRA